MGKGRDITSEREKLGPHVIIEAHINATKRLWDKLELKPVVWTPNLFVSRLFGKMFEDGNFVLKLMRFRRLNANLFGAADDENIIQDFEECIEEAQKRFGLWPNGKLDVVLIGSHTTLSSHDDAGENQGGHPNTQDSMPYQLGHRIDRTYCALVYRVLSSFKQLNVQWLSYVDDTLLPNQDLNDLSPAFRTLPKRAAEVLSKYERGTDPNTTLVKPAIPLIFYRTQETSDWEKFSGAEETDNPRTPTTTTKLVKDFGAWGNTHSFHDAVLVKMLTHDISAYTPLDPPYLRELQIREANAAGINKIFLDSRIGILQTVTGEAPAPPPVYAIHPPEDV